MKKNKTESFNRRDYCSPLSPCGECVTCKITKYNLEMLKKTEGRFRYVLEMSEESGMVEPVLVFDHEGEETHVPLGEKVCLEDLIVTIKTK